MSILGQESITLLRPTGAGTRDATGAFVPAGTTSSTILASWQPVTGQEAASLPEGERHRDWQKVYTTTALQPVDQHTGQAGDRVVIDGITYEVRRVKRYRRIIPHYRAEVVRIQEGGA